MVYVSSFSGIKIEDQTGQTDHQRSLMWTLGLELRVETIVKDGPHIAESYSGAIDSFDSLPLLLL